MITFTSEPWRMVGVPSACAGTDNSHLPYSSFLKGCDSHCQLSESKRKCNSLIFTVYGVNDSECTHWSHRSDRLELLPAPIREQQLHRPAGNVCHSICMLARTYPSHRHVHRYDWPNRERCYFWRIIKTNTHFIKQISTLIQSTPNYIMYDPDYWQPKLITFYITLTIANYLHSSLADELEYIFRNISRIGSR